MATTDELLDMAAAYHESGNALQAQALCRQILQADPGHAAAHHLLGLTAHQTGNHADAIALIRRAIVLNPANDDCHFNLGIIFMKLGQRTEAIDCYRQALRINPNHAMAYNNMGNVLMDERQLEEATKCYRQAVRINPGSAIMAYNLGNALRDQGQLAEAALCYRQAIANDPRHADAHNNLGGIHKMQKRVAEAVTCYRQALGINPQLAGAYLNLAVALGEPEQLAEAAECYQQALRLVPDYVDARHNLSMALMVLGRVVEATEQNEQGLRLQPDYGPGLWQRALLRLLKGEFEGGWQDYEQRWSQPNQSPPSFKQPRWDGSPLAGKTVLVHAEQGLGDTVQFVRYLPMIKERGGTVLFQCQRGLVEICTGMRGIDQLAAVGAPLPPYDVQVALLSLPGIFGTTLATIPAPVPYLRADPGLVNRWAQELAALDGLRVGIVWQGRTQHMADRYRSVPLTRFEPLTRLKRSAAY